MPDKDIYLRILKKALAYYRKGRQGDVEHINWLFDIVPKCVKQSDADLSILMPVVLLHDVGYSRVPKKGSDPYKLDIRTLHSVEGAKIAEQILTQLDYPKNKIAEIKRLIIKHDNWAFGDSFVDEPILRIFNNFDFMWMASEEGFGIVRKFTKKTPEEFYRQILDFQKKNELEGRSWFSKDIELLYKRLMKERKAEILSKN